MSAAPPEVTVCTVTYRSGHVVGRCLRAVRSAAEASGLTPEVRVVDNASDDDTLDRVREAWPDATVERNRENVGYAAAVNRAVAGGHGRWLLLLNPDTLLAPDTLAIPRRAERLPGIAGVSPLLVDESGAPTRTAYSWPTLRKELARLAGAEALARGARAGRPAVPPGAGATVDGLGEVVRVAYAAGACLFLPVDAWSRVGPFDEGFRLYHEEMEWCWRAARLGLGVYVATAFRATHLGERSSRERPEEVERWRYEGLLRFYELHRPAATGVALRAAVAASFGVRALAARLAGAPRPEREELVRAALRRGGGTGVRDGAHGGTMAR